MSVKPVPEGYHSVIPYLAVTEVGKVIEFLKAAFGATENHRMAQPNGTIMHAEVKIGDSMLMIGGGEAWRGTPKPMTLHLYVRDADATYRRALEAGATSIEEPGDKPYGDREAGVKDFGGNTWYVGTHKATGHAPPGMRSLTPYMLPQSVAELIAFLTKALGAEEKACHAAPDGRILHAAVRIGDSMLEMGEAPGPYQPQPTLFYLYVDDVDAAYQRAVQAGATSLSEPADMPYGDRVAAVTDPFGNKWYLATHVRDVSA